MLSKEYTAVRIFYYEILIFLWNIRDYVACMHLHGFGHMFDGGRRLGSNNSDVAAVGGSVAQTLLVVCGL